jgi:hypothetical protein
MNDVTEAVKEAERFLKKAQELKSKHQEIGDAMFWGSPETGAVKRASMDLTRALAKIRR